MAPALTMALSALLVGQVKQGSKVEVQNFWYEKFVKMNGVHIAVKVELFLLIFFFTDTSFAKALTCGATVLDRKRVPSEKWLKMGFVQKKKRKWACIRYRKSSIKSRPLIQVYLY